MNRSLPLIVCLLAMLAVSVPGCASNQSTPAANTDAREATSGWVDGTVDQAVVVVALPDLPQGTHVSVEVDVDLAGATFDQWVDVGGSTGRDGAGSTQTGGAVGDADQDSEQTTDADGTLEIPLVP